MFKVWYTMIMYLVVGFIFFGLPIYMGYKYHKGKKAQSTHRLAREAGESGERQVTYALSWLDKTKYRVFNNIRLKSSYGDQQFDHIVLSQIGGIFSIETKLYAGEITIDQYGNWVRSKNGVKEGIESPLFQVQRHRKVLEDILPEKYHSYIIDVVCIACASAVLTGLENFPIKVIKVGQLVHYIEDHVQETVLSREDTERIADIITQCQS